MLNDGLNLSTILFQNATYSKNGYYVLVKAADLEYQYRKIIHLFNYIYKQE